MRAREGDSRRKMSAMHRVWIGVIAAIGVTLTLQPAQPSRFDVLIRHARVMDGSGNPWLRADVGVSGDRIAAVGRLDAATAARIIDARDQLVTPGFVDVHSHAADGIVHPPLRQAQPLLAQGVTTFVANPDGGGPVDFTMAWVSVPDLAVRPSLQRYTAIRVDGDRHIVRYEDEDGFMADIVFDPDGLVLDYPSLARRLG